MVQEASATELNGAGAPAGKITLVEFPTIGDAKAWWNSPFFQGLVMSHKKYMKTRVYTIEGVRSELALRSLAAPARAP